MVVHFASNSYHWGGVWKFGNSMLKLTNMRAYFTELTGRNLRRWRGPVGTNDCSKGFLLTVKTNGTSAAGASALVSQ